jgi:DDE family transposase
MRFSASTPPNSRSASASAASSTSKFACDPRPAVPTREWSTPVSSSSPALSANSGPSDQPLRRALGANLLRETYRLRWQVELIFKELKQHLSLEVLPSKDQQARRSDLRLGVARRPPALADLERLDLAPPSDRRLGLGHPASTRHQGHAPDLAHPRPRPDRLSPDGNAATAHPGRRDPRRGRHARTPAARHFQPSPAPARWGLRDRRWGRVYLLSLGSCGVFGWGCFISS